VVAIELNICLVIATSATSTVDDRLMMSSEMKPNLRSCRGDNSEQVQVSKDFFGNNLVCRK
jgi:hypothetical protein